MRVERGWASARARLRANLRAAGAGAALALFLLVPPVSASPSGSGPEATLGPPVLAFPDRPPGTASDAEPVTVTNTGDAPLAISTFRLTGPDAGDFSQGAICPVAPDTLAAGASCTIYVAFRPSTAGPKSATLAIGDDAPSSPQTVTLTGAGVTAPHVLLTPTAVDFGGLQVGTQSQARTVTVENTGDATLAFTSIGLAGADAADFSRATTCDLVNGLAAGASCTVDAVFAPQSNGDKSAQLVLADNAPDSPQVVTLTGTATTPGGTGLPPGTWLSEDFESGSLAHWEALSSPGSSIALDPGSGNSGSASVRLTNSAPDESSRLAADLAGGGESQSYTRFCFQVAAGLSQGIELANGRAITQEYPLGIRRWEITYNPVTHGLEGYFFNEALERLELYAGNGQVLEGHWYCAELYLDERAQGGARLWLNGTEIGSVSGDLSTPSPFSRLYLWNQPSAGSVWFDDVRVASTPAP